MAFKFFSYRSLIHSNVAEVVRLRFSPPHPEVSRLLLLPAPAEVMIKALASQRVLSVDRRCVDARKNSYWSISVDFVTSSGASSQSRKKARIDYREVLTPEQFQTYAQLRELRSNVAQAEAVPREFIADLESNLPNMKSKLLAGSFELSRIRQ